MKIRKKRVNLSACVVNAMNLLRYNYEKKEITVENKIDPDTFVTGDDHILVSVLQNFIANAIKFTHRKGTIVISAEKRQANVIVTVKDNGVGIKPEMIEKLFRLDAQTTTAGTENEAGTGLGLIICKEMLERLGGYIEIQSKVNEGTAVIFGITAAD
ncbi:MAG: sensor histidine kinase [Ignavibacteria bacterium]